MSDNSRRRKFRRPAKVHALVISCHRQDGSRADIWQGRKVVIALLTCSHTIRRVMFRQLLTGEKVVCPKCTAALAVTRPLPFDSPEASA